MRAGYRDFRQLRGDPDLEALRADERFEGLMRRFERQEAEQKKGERSMGGGQGRRAAACMCATACVEWRSPLHCRMFVTLPRCASWAAGFLGLF